MLNATLYNVLVQFILIATDKVAHNNILFRRITTT